MIYFAQPISGGPVKIGYSENIPARIRQLEAHYGQPLAVLATIEGGYEEEQAIHARFAHLRLDGAGRRGVQPEQFRPTAELMNFIGRPILVDANPDAVEAISPRSKPDPSRTRSSLLTIRCFQDWKDTMERLAEFDRSASVADLLDRAVVAYARSIGFPDQIPKR